MEGMDVWGRIVRWRFMINSAAAARSSQQIEHPKSLHFFRKQFDNSMQHIFNNKVIVDFHVHMVPEVHEPYRVWNSQR